MTKTEFDIMTVEEVSKQSKLSPRVVVDAMREGELPGRNHGGNKGWTTTRRALLEWIESGNVERRQQKEESRNEKED